MSTSKNKTILFKPAHAIILLQKKSKTHNLSKSTDVKTQQKLKKQKKLPNKNKKYKQTQIQSVLRLTDREKIVSTVFKIRQEEEDTTKMIPLRSSISSLEDNSYTRRVNYRIRDLNNKSLKRSIGNYPQQLISIKISLKNNLEERKQDKKNKLETPKINLIKQKPQLLIKDKQQNIFRVNGWQIDNGQSIQEKVKVRQFLGFDNIN